MSAEDTTAAQQPSEVSGKSKGKQAEQVEAGDMSMDDDEDSAEDSGVEEVRTRLFDSSETSRTLTKP